LDMNFDELDCFSLSLHTLKHLSVEHFF
jgi:hypothetical protein